jgi:hypothetical protein
MIAAIVLVIGLFFLGVQITDPSSNATLASQLNIPADQALTDWAILNSSIHFILDDIPLAGVLLFAAGTIYWISDWLNEKLGLLGRSPPAVPAQSEPK